MQPVMSTIPFRVKTIIVASIPQNAGEIIILIPEQIVEVSLVLTHLNFEQFPCVEKIANKATTCNAKIFITSFLVLKEPPPGN